MSCQFPLLRHNDTGDLGQPETDSETFVLAYVHQANKKCMNLF